MTLKFECDSMFVEYLRDKVAFANFLFFSISFPHCKVWEGGGGGYSTGHVLLRTEHLLLLVPDFKIALVPQVCKPSQLA